ncbi:hypothetical protein [Myroides odoratus]|uniref:hypothetical protein n=1 Tax=Myroides odoratus TaxID=256 RepID=UPI000765B58E|nr:hypothetical protein [Myroides odoratus]
MKKGLFLAAALFVLGASTMVASTVATATTIQKSVVENNDEVERSVYRIQIYDNHTGELIQTEVGCFTGEEVVQFAEDLIAGYGGYNEAYAMVALLGDC